MVQTVKKGVYMIRKFILYLFLTALSLQVNSQEKAKHIYNPSIHAVTQIHHAIDSASKSHKHVLIQVGGNWCSWCIRMHDFIEGHYKLDSLIQADYVFIRVNYSKENKNPEAMELLDFPQRFGFPVLVILDENGNRIHTQNTGYLEEDNSYSEKIFFSFLKAWNKEGIDPANYK